MHLWPFSPPQLLKVSPRSTALSNEQINDNEIKQCLTLPQSNVTIFLHPCRVQIYNFKPFALVASHERTQKSIDEFGQNKFMVSSTSFSHPIKGLMNEEETINITASLQRKSIVYVITEKNYILIYQILKNSSNVTIFQDYGILDLGSSFSKEPLSNEFAISQDSNDDGNDDTDDDTLTVYDKNNTSKIIQNGYIVSKAKGFLNFLTNTQDDLAELPVKRLELRLKVVLKFDYEILDVVGFKRFAKIGDGKFEENLLILFPHGLQILNLIDFKLNKSHLINIKDSKRICILQNQLFVIAEDKEKNKITIHEIDAENQKTEEITIDGTSKPFKSCFTFNKRIVFIHENIVRFYDPIKKKLSHSWNTSTKNNICKPLNDDVLLVISEENNFYVFTKFGNQLVSYEKTHESDKQPALNYSDFSFCNKTLITTSKNGDYKIWPYWEESKQPFSDFRTTKPYILHNNKNEILLYSPTNESTSNKDIFQSIRLPTKTINNYYPLVRLNSTSKLLSTFIANKNLLLIYNTDTNNWYNFPHVTILDMQWLGHTYLVCYAQKEDGSRSIQCLNFPLQNLGNREFSDLIIWEYDLTEDMNVISIHVNSLFKYKLLKLKNKDEKNSTTPNEVFFKTAEIILITNHELIVLDVISTIHLSGINIIKKLHQFARVTLPEDIDGRDIKWVTNYRDGLLFLSDDKIFKIEKIASEEWLSVMLLEKVERIIDVLREEIYLIHENKYTIYRLDDLWDDKEPILTIPVEENSYIISASPGTATAYTLECVFTEGSSRLVVKHDIYLDKVICAKIEQEVDPEEITIEFRQLKHYNFALEKILSSKMLSDDPLDKIIALIKYSDEFGDPTKHTNLLEIVSNCLRKIETKYWNKLFTSLQMTPRDLLGYCIDGNESRILGILFLVFLNYDETDLVQDLKKNASTSGTETIPEDETVTQYKTDNSVVSLVKDEELMLQILRVLVTSAATATDATKAVDAWDMCFQLARLMKELDKENNTQLVQDAMKMFQ
ncbi:Ric1p NDAI_0E01780 [Naumovozyma dairenensis CBS 421]|uniref:RIC1 C-terminal alpha solenoid region domain-containing protein n=1 Tax=Naumovozyma dairenensis (strain ATCC 10597 / BCRC 20456 / CBS 421 / NBRC 0211 / NRRL Y-12639) TaxID=1071378 RepID=G0WB74_NAUDC|nr:hypothetical protein NDAI_0E01780 [Naumovozyma dairenensis CBS 421]CCD24994.1 hypothetical protein NDAI_0E01780 [Naumovozyma dairenensis CBS 421]